MRSGRKLGIPDCSMTFWVMHFSAVVPVTRSRSWQRSW